MADIIPPLNPQQSDLEQPDPEQSVARPVHMTVKGGILKPFAELVFGTPLRHRVPERVLRNVRNEQNNSEILVGWIQITLVCVFSALYSLSPKMAAPGAFQAVPWALGLYFLLTLARLITSYRCELPTWVLMGSIILDIGLLMTLIWSFHIQYEQPPSFYLKAPTLLYVFIFISLRALRFEPLYVLLAGGTAVIGWMILVLFVMYSDPTNPMITRNYVEYMTSNSVLIGAEVDKVISMVVVTLILAITLQRGQVMMCHAAMDQMAAKDLSRFVPREISDHIVKSEETIKSGDGVLKTATALFTDIEGFSTVSENCSPRDLVSMLNDYVGAVHKIVKKHGGSINNYHGDAMLILFDEDHNGQSHAANAIHTAIEIRDVLGLQLFGNGITLKTRCGINTGEMTVGTIGADDLLIYTVHGDEVNLAARLEQLNKDYGTYILVSEQTRDAATDITSGINADSSVFENRGQVVVRGRTKPTAIFSII
jgi:adenylate cyclase